MAQAASFDITSTVDLQEVDNAVNQARKEIAQRYDFKGSRAAIELNQTDNTHRPDRRRRVQDDRAVGNPADAHGPARRADQEPDARRDRARRQRHRPAGVTLQQGIPTEAAKEIVKFLKDKKLKKVQAAIMADQVRVTSPSKDELQEAMRQLREHDFGVRAAVRQLPRLSRPAA